MNELGEINDQVIFVQDVTVDDDFLAMQEELEERGISIYYGNILQRPKKEVCIEEDNGF